jgi:CDP-paratose 2-epimerase
MKILITGGCGFVGSNLAVYLKKNRIGKKIDSLDNLTRRGSFLNLIRLKKINIKNFKIDILNFLALKKLPKYDLIIDCCAEAAVEKSKSDPDKVFYTNLVGTYNILKKCIKDNSNIIFLSSSRVYSIKKLIKMKKIFSVNEEFTTSGPKSIYGFCKYSSEQLIKEFSFLHKTKYIINRLGVISGPWQFGKQDQGFVSLWVWKHMNKKKLSYIGFGGKGKQVRDVIHIYDVCKLIELQIKNLKNIFNLTVNVG